jgi:hypothetical protein
MTQNEAPRPARIVAYEAATDVVLASPALDHPIRLTPDEAAKLASQLTGAAEDAIHASRSSRRVMPRSGPPSPEIDPVASIADEWRRAAARLGLAPVALCDLPMVPLAPSVIRCLKPIGHPDVHRGYGLSGAKVVWSA